MTARIFLSTNASYAPERLAELVQKHDVLLFDTRPFDLTKGNSRKIGSARHYAKLLGDRYEDADYIAAQINPEQTQNILLGRAKPILILCGASQLDDLFSYLRGFGFLCELWWGSFKRKPLFDFMIGGIYAE